jgi:ABC-type sulfate transport system permease component
MHISKNADDVFAVIPVLILLVLTPWPLAMMIASAIGLAALFAVFRGRQLRGALLTALISFTAAAAIAILIWLGRSH